MPSQSATVKISPNTPTIKQTYQGKVVKSPAPGSSQQIKVAAVTPQGVTRIVSGVGTPSTVRVSTAQSSQQIVIGTAGGTVGSPRFVQVKTGSGGMPVKLAGNAVPLKIGAANIHGKIATNSMQKVGTPLKLGPGNVKIGTSNVLVKTAGGMAIQAGVASMQAKGMPVKLGAGNLPVIGGGGAIKIASSAMAGQQPVYKIVTAKAGEQMVTTAAGGAGATVLRQAGGNAGMPVIIKKTPGGGQSSSAPQYVTLVKTSTGMTVATVPKMAMVQNRGAVTTSVGQGIAPGATIVKLVSANSVGGSKIITLPSNMLQLGKAGVGGKQTIVITKSASQQQPQ